MKINTNNMVDLVTAHQNSKCVGFEYDLGKSDPSLRPSHPTYPRFVNDLMNKVNTCEEITAIGRAYDKAIKQNFERLLLV